LLNAASGTATVPTTIPVGQDVEFLKIHASAGTWTGARSGSETFGGATSFTISDQYERQVWTKVTSTRWERKLWSMGAQEYEPGTWTPEFLSSVGSFGTITYNTQSGRYVRMGNRVDFWIQIITDSLSVGTASGVVQISLPMVSIATNQGGFGVYSSEYGDDN